MLAVGILPLKKERNGGEKITTFSFNQIRGVSINLIYM
jgi:hypothetical protein